MDDDNTLSAPDDTTALLQLSLQEINALKVLANETLNQPPPYLTNILSVITLRSLVKSTQTSQPLNMPSLQHNLTKLLYIFFIVTYPKYHV